MIQYHGTNMQSSGEPEGEVMTYIVEDYRNSHRSDSCFAIDVDDPFLPLATNKP